MKNLNKSNSNLLIGLLVIFIGIIYLLKNLHFFIPHWLFSWHFIFMILGIGMLIKHNFRSFGGAVFALIGAYYTLEDVYGIDFNFSAYFWPLALVVAGLVLIFKPKGNPDKCRKKWHRYMNNDSSFDAEEYEFEKNTNDFMSSVNVFGASQQAIYSKNFKGGEAISVFGGCEINFSQTDFENQAILEVVAVFGGVKMIVPSNWEIKSEITTIFGGVEDKRKMYADNEMPKKTLILKGIVLFGGIEIKNY